MWPAQPDTCPGRNSKNSVHASAVTQKRSQKPKIQNSKSEKQKEKRRTVPNRKVSEHLTLAKGLEKSGEIRGGPGPTT